jgi:hypothetical protein
MEFICSLDIFFVTRQKSLPHGIPCYITKLIMMRLNGRKGKNNKQQTAAVNTANTTATAVGGGTTTTPPPNVSTTVATATHTLHVPVTSTIPKVR